MFSHDSSTICTTICAHQFGDGFHVETEKKMATALPAASAMGKWQMAAKGLWPTATPEWLTCRAND